MRKHNRKIVSSCDNCQKMKESPYNHGLMVPVLVDKPGSLVCIDLMGPFPPSRGEVTQLLLITDAFSKYHKLYALKHATTNSILNKLVNCYFPQENSTELVKREIGRLLRTPVSDKHTHCTGGRTLD